MVVVVVVVTSDPRSHKIYFFLFLWFRLRCGSSFASGLTGGFIDLERAHETSDLVVNVCETAVLLHFLKLVLVCELEATQQLLGGLELGRSRERRKSSAKQAEISVEEFMKGSNDDADTWKSSSIDDALLISRIPRHNT